jgi:elongator complex protein 3
MKSKPTRTISGVTPVAVMLPPRPCPHGACLFCPSLNAPQSYTPESPAVLRAKSFNYDPFKQVQQRLKTLSEMGHPTDKVELIIMGGTFLSYDRHFQINFIKDCYDGLNNIRAYSISEAKKINETSRHRCVALCIETRPDYCNDSQIKDMLLFGTTRVELGVQAIDNDIYKKTNRGHTLKDVIDSTKRLRQAGFKIGYHIMPGIPGSNLKKDFKMFEKLFSSEDFKPDQLKIYPCQVLKGAGIEGLYLGGEYIPYTKEETKKLLIKMISITPRYCRIMRIMREIPPFYLVAGIKNIDLRKEVEEDIRKNKIRIKEIRYREVGFALRDKIKINEDQKIKITKYKASDGKEYFIEMINNEDILFGLLRLRLEKDKNLHATVRELHVYGKSLNIGETSLEEIQHKGIGKKLLEEAEKISKKNKRNRVRIISGVGAREYYKKLGYTLDKEGIYMEKRI